MKKEAKEVRRRYCVHLRRGASSCFIVVESSPSSSQLKIFIRTPRRIFSQAFFLFIFAPTAFVCSYSPWSRRAELPSYSTQQSGSHIYFHYYFSRIVTLPSFGSRRFILDHPPIRSTRRSFGYLYGRIYSTVILPVTSAATWGTRYAPSLVINPVISYHSQHIPSF